MKNLPLGINTLSTIRQENMVYVDKTAMAWQLIKQTGRFFLSRPRRFGKSLFVDTLKEIFEGNKDLFEGLYIHDKWDWTKTYPVIKIDFAGGTLEGRSALDELILEILESNRETMGVVFRTNSVTGRFKELICGAKEKYGQRVVVLVDEYDKPILDNIDDPEIAAEMRDGLKNLYSVLKEQDANLQFVFLTGVSKFSKVSLFSGVNQLTDLTIDASCSSICGYTHEDLQTVFAEHLEGVDWDKIQAWYNGYSWTGRDTVYNPYDILLFIKNERAYRNYWFETGNPSFLVKLFQKNRYFLPNLETLDVTEQILDSFDTDVIDPVTLLFQSGYLTIKKTFTQRNRYMFRLRVPNQEVKNALGDVFLDGYTGQVPSEKLGFQNQLASWLEKGDVEGILGVIRRLFASIPYRNFINNDLPDCEGYYASVLYAFFSSLNATIIPEDVTNHGQVDLTVRLGGFIYVMEIKVIDGDDCEGNSALEQIQQRGYAEKYRGVSGTRVFEVGLVFGRKERNLLKADWEEKE